ETVHRRGYRFLPPVTTQPVSSAKFQVSSSESSSQNPEVGSQEEVGNIQQEENQKAKGEQISRVGTAHHEEGSAATGTVGDAYPTELPSHDSGFGTQHLPSSAPTHFWPRKVLILAVVLLLIGTALTVHYLSRSTLSTEDSALRTDAAPQALALPDKPSI